MLPDTPPPPPLPLFGCQVRVVGILPNKLIGIVGSHEDFPIERLAISADK